MILSLNEYVADDVTRPPEWKCSKPSRCTLPEFEESEAPSSGPSPPATARGPSPVPAATAVLPESAAVGSPVTAGAAAPARPMSATGAEPPPLPPAQAELVAQDADPESNPARTREDRELKEAMMRSLEEGAPADAAEQVHFPKSCVEDDQSLCSTDLAGDFTYRLVSVVSHHGGNTHSGHYVSDVYSVDRDPWYHYDDRRVSCVDEAEVLGEGHQKNGYIFFYLHKDLCNQAVSVEGAGGAL
ncbi:Ubiquitin carboxyl-terminal hydrolase 37 [Amphibalanus amphitrite]|uniref:Ubiquitin carboxyl-terminal hydrolase 37 n=1 Tax=Amphibalanus amphitrite TaxID=1232801 RepID=A0A6A4VWD2_AMPAM|nr:Ubiquitin carboxyl-terminal hydrolase 37 [Amphibalanus amphitrite]